MEVSKIKVSAGAISEDSSFKNLPGIPSGPPDFPGSIF